MKLATNNQNNNLTKVGVLLDFGRYSNRFDYLDGKYLGVEIGDIVSVRLKGRLMSGLVVDKDLFKKECNDKVEIKYLFVEDIIQKKVLPLWWQDWMEELAKFYKVDRLKMYKTAFPPGWIGKNVKNKQKPTLRTWIIYNEDAIFLDKLTNKQLSLINYLKSKKGVWQTEILKLGFTTSTVNTLIKKDFLKKERMQKKHNFSYVFNDKVPENSNIFALTNQQKVAIEAIQDMRSGEIILLWGETGSGKTEIYLRTVQRQLSMRKSCLVLAPEIALIPQLIDRFSERFHINVFEYHSNCSPKHRQLVWQKLLNENDPIIVIGTRSAVFLPIKNLGIIILDEEHDASYKQESPMPCYDAREVAIDRMKINNSKIVFGTATPSLNILKKIYFEKKYKLVRMKERISQTKIPDICIVDMREEFKKGNSRIFSEELLNILSQLKENKEQALILVPRRGYSGFLSCRNCGHVVSCPNCDVALTVHIGSKGQKWLNCHWCDMKRRFINICPDCNSNAFKPFGIGTQRVIQFINEELPELRLIRFDKDTTSGKDGHRKILESFTKGNADVIVGTQMIAKGIDIPNVTLSVVLAADGLLHRPDLSSEEKSLQLFLQLAGRSGRASKPGKVIFQTYQPNHPVISYLKKRDYEGFSLQILKTRQEANLFPFCKVCLLKVSGINNSSTEETACKLASYLEPLCNKKDWKLIGPAPGLVSKISKKFRWQILIYGPDNSEFPLPNHEFLFDLIPKNVYLTIDINPVEI